MQDQSMHWSKFLQIKKYSLYMWDCNIPELFSIHFPLFRFSLSSLTMLLSFTTTKREQIHLMLGKRKWEVVWPWREATHRARAGHMKQIGVRGVALPLPRVTSSPPLRCGALFYSSVRICISSDQSHCSMWRDKTLRLLFDPLKCKSTIL